MEVGSLTEDAKLDKSIFPILADPDWINRVVNRTSSMYTIIVIGQVSSGKSSFINSLLVRRLLVPSDKPTDGVVSVLLAAKPGGRYEQGLRELVEEHKQRMLVEVRGLHSKSGVLTYLKSGYWDSANAVLDAMLEESKQTKGSILELYRGARELQLISLDRKLLGLGASEREKVRNKVTGFFYGLKSIWDFLFGGVVELNANNRKAAREILRGEVLGFIDHLNDAVEVWSRQAKRVRQQAVAEYADRRELLAARKSNSSNYAERLQKRLNFLAKGEPLLSDLCRRIEEFAENLGKAKARIESSRQPDFSAFLFTEDEQVPLRKGREQDMLMLSVRSKSRWKWLEIKSGGRSKRFLPVTRGDGRWVAFFNAPVTGKEKQRPVVAPEYATRFELRLSTLEGRFFGKKRAAAPISGNRELEV